MAGLGYPVTWAVVTIPAFDMVSDTLRSLRGSTLDMFRQPEKLLAMIDLMQVPTVASAVMARAGCSATRGSSSPCTAAPAAS